jgi:hypothetical protein
MFLRSTIFTAGKLNFSCKRKKGLSGTNYRVHLPESKRLLLAMKIQLQESFQARHTLQPETAQIQYCGIHPLFYRAREGRC